MNTDIASDQSSKMTGTSWLNQEQQIYVGDYPAESKKELFETNTVEENKMWHHNLIPITEQLYWEIYTL